MRYSHESAVDEQNAWSIGMVFRFYTFIFQPEPNSAVKSTMSTTSFESPSTSSNNQSSKSSNPRAIGSILPVDRDNLVKFDAHHKSMPVSDKRRSHQSRELHDLLFVIVGDVDTTKKLCMHAYSGVLYYSSCTVCP